MKAKIEIKNSFTGIILFEFETENNNIKRTVEEAIKVGANLDGANLYRANLDGANLVGASLDGASLYRASLDGANLDGANLVGANLDGASLYRASLDRASLDRASLDGANLDGASLDGASLDGASLYRASLDGASYKDVIINKTAVFTGLYKYTSMPIISKDGKEYIRLGCYTRLVSEWENDFWNNHKEFPNNGDIDSKYRLMAFDFCKKWLELNR